MQDHRPTHPASGFITTLNSSAPGTQNRRTRHSTKIPLTNAHTRTNPTCRGLLLTFYFRITLPAGSTRRTSEKTQSFTRSDWITSTYAPHAPRFHQRLQCVPSFLKIAVLPGKTPHAKPNTSPARIVIKHTKTPAAPCDAHGCFGSFQTRINLPLLDLDPVAARLGKGQPSARSIDHHPIARFKHAR